MKHDESGRGREARVAVNQATFRIANEEIAAKAVEYDAREGLLPFVCECERRECRSIVRMTFGEYRLVREDAARFVVASGHEGHAVEHVVEATSRYVVVAKEGAAAEIAAALDREPTMDPRQEKIGRNEAVFRSTNDRLRSLNESFATVSDTMTLVCECGDLDCIEQIDVSVAEYEALRADPTLFAIKPQHVYPDVEDVESQGDHFWVIRKRPGGPAELARALDTEPS